VFEPAAEGVCGAPDQIWRDQMPSGAGLTPGPAKEGDPDHSQLRHQHSPAMASPFPKYVEVGENAKIRQGITLRDYRKDRPDGKM
jgi:hypothetical protein